MARGDFVMLKKLPRRHPLSGESREQFRVCASCLNADKRRIPRHYLLHRFDAPYKKALKCTCRRSRRQGAPIRPYSDVSTQTLLRPEPFPSPKMSKITEEMPWMPLLLLTTGNEPNPVKFLAAYCEGGEAAAWQPHSTRWRGDAKFMEMSRF